MTPTGPNPAASPSPSIPLTLPTEISSAPQAEQGNKYEHIQPQPKPAEQQPWLSRPIRGGCVKGSSTSTSHVQTTTSAGQFAVLEEDDEAEFPACGSQVEPTSPILGSVAVVLTADVRTEDNRSSHRSSLSPGEIKRKTDGQQRGMAPEYTVTVFMTLKRHERSSFRNGVAGLHLRPDMPLPLGARSPSPPADFVSLE